MIRKTILWGVFVMALLLLALPMYFLQERNGSDAAEIHNSTADHIWIAYDLGERRAVILELPPDETGPVCFNDATNVYVHGSAPTADEPLPPPLATVDFDGEDFCDGTYRWDGLDALPRRVEVIATFSRYRPIA